MQVREERGRLKVPYHRWGLVRAGWMWKIEWRGGGLAGLTSLGGRRAQGLQVLQQGINIKRGVRSGHYGDIKCLLHRLGEER